METRKIKILEPNEYVMTGIQFTLPIALYFGITSGASWLWWVASIVMFLAYTVIGNNLALHRYYTHDEFTIGPVGEFIFGFLTLTLCLGSPVSYAILHITHHKYPESGPDWTWRDLPFYKHVWFDETTIKPYIGKRVIQLHRRYGWMHDYNLLWIVAYPVTLYLISYELFLFLWWIPVTLAMLEIALAVYFQHRETARNYRWHWLFPTWEGLHKNHHDYPGYANNAREQGQIDYTFLLSKLFARKYRHED